MALGVGSLVLVAQNNRPEGGKIVKVGIRDYRWVIDSEGQKGTTEWAARTAAVKDGLAMKQELGRFLFFRKNKDIELRLYRFMIGGGYFSKPTDVWYVVNFEVDGVAESGSTFREEGEARLHFDTLKAGYGDDGVSPHSPVQ